MNKNEKLYEAINCNRPDIIEEMFHNQEINISEYETAKKALEEMGFIDLAFTPEKNAEQYKRATNFYNALIAFAIMDIIPMAWTVLFFLYIPVGIYILIVAFGEKLILPDEDAVKEHSQIGMFILLSLIPGFGIIADILILMKASRLKGAINIAIAKYTTAYNDQVRINRAQDN